jgi:DNA-binding MarR family transcriptional regulator
MQTPPRFDLPPDTDWRTLLPLCLRQAGQRVNEAAAAGELLLRFTASARALHNGLMRIFGPAGFTDHKFTVLVVLSATDPRPSTASQLAAHASITRASMTNVLDDLERRGWIARQRNSADRRTIRVKLTASGRRAIAKATALFLGIAAEMVRPLAPSDLSGFVRTCTQLRQTADTLPGDIPLFQL